MSLYKVIRSWLEGEEHLRAMADLCGGKLAAELDELLATLRRPGAKRRTKIEATHRLNELLQAAAKNAGTRHSPPHVWPHEWHWGRPGSDEDLELLEQS